MLASFITTADLLIWMYMMCVIAWAVLSTLVSFNIVNPYQPFAQRSMQVLDRLVQPALRPIQRLLPNFGGIDLSPIVLIFLLTFLQRAIYGLMDAQQLSIAFVQLIDAFLVLYMYCVGIFAVLGLLINFKLVNPYQRLVQIVMSILRALVNKPVIALRRYVPPVGKVDLAPWILLLLLFVARRALYMLLAL